MVRTTRPLFPDDSIQRAVTLLKASGGSAAPVIAGAQVVGIVCEADLVGLLSASSNNGNGPDMDQLPPVGRIMRPATAFAQSHATIRQAAELFSQTGAEALPVITPQGAYTGYLLRSDITTILSGAIRPPVVGGLATPLGVHLTCGSQRGGVGDAGLVLLGVLFGVMNILGFALAAGAFWIVQKWLGQPLFASLMSEPIAPANVYDIVAYAAAAIPILTVLLGIKFSRVAGYHAAEHQTVHAIEQGEPLEYDFVRHMPRVHPRCGTNIAAASSIFIVLISAFPSPLIVFAAIIIVLLAWRSIGAWLQYYVTTKPASQKEIESGIRAGRQLLENYQDEMLGNRPAGKRLWNIGFTQIGIGLAITMLLAHAMVRMLHLPLTMF